jgi:hypothetical protein
MTDRQAAVVGIPPAPPARLEPNAIGVAQDTVIGMASSAPAATVGLSLAALAAATSYGSGPILLLTAIPMLVIWSLLSVVGVGLLLLLSARFILRSTFFQMERESDSRRRRH